MMILILMLLVVMLIGLGIQQSPVKTYDQQMKAVVMKDYDYNSNPSISQMILDIALEIGGILSVDQKTSRVSLKIVQILRWKDERLKWNSTKYGDLTETQFATDTEKRIWTPDTALKQSDGKMQFPILDFSPAIVQSDGTVIWARPGVIKLIHKFNLKSFPYDVQKVRMDIEIWSRPELMIRMVTWRNEVDKKRQFDPIFSSAVQQQNIQWSIQSRKLLTSDPKDFQYSGIQFSGVSYEVQLKRKGQTTIYVMYQPGMLVCGLSIFAYFLPINSIIRIQFTTTILLTLIMFLLMITRFLPITSEDPLIEKLFLGLVSIVFCCDLFVVLIAFYQTQYQQYQQKLKKKQNADNGDKKKQAQQKEVNVNIAQLQNMHMNNDGEDDLQSIVSISEDDPNDEARNKQIVLQNQVNQANQMYKMQKQFRWKQYFKMMIEPKFIDTVGFFCIFMGYFIFITQNLIQLDILENE